MSEEGFELTVRILEREGERRIDTEFYKKNVYCPR